MPEADKPEVRSFTSRVRRRTSVDSASGTRIIEAENQFPFDRIDFVRIGSAHNKCKPENDDRTTDLLKRIATYIMTRYEPDKLPANIEIRETLK